MDYAKEKLLDGPNELRKGNWTGSLACFSTRFALEFNIDGTVCGVTHVMTYATLRCSNHWIRDHHVWFRTASS